MWRQKLKYWKTALLISGVFALAITLDNLQSRDIRPWPESSLRLWRAISSMNPENGNVPELLKPVLGREIELVGFVIPNDASSINEMSEFLLTPVSAGCIHVPPPPPNFLVHVALAPGSSSPILYGQVVVKGRLAVPKADKDRKYFSLEMAAQSVSAFTGGT